MESEDDSHTTSDLERRQMSDTTADIVVFGAGLEGAAVALYLAREGADVLVVEAADTAPVVGLGHVELGVVEQPRRTVAALGVLEATALFAFTERNKALIKQEGWFDPCGALWSALSGNERDDVAGSESVLGSMGVVSERWTAEQSNEHTGARSLGPSLWLPGDGRLVAGAHDALIEAAREAGVRFAFASALTPQTVSAELAVVAAGVRSGRYERALSEATVPVRDCALLTAPTSAIHSGNRRAGHGWTTWRDHPSGGVVVSGARWGSPHLEVGETDTDALNPAVVGKLTAFASKTLGLRGLPIIDQWAWTFDQSRDQLPIIGPIPGDARTIALCGLGPAPATFAFAAARAIADGVLSDGPPVPVCLASTRLVRWRRG